MSFVTSDLLEPSWYDNIGAPFDAVVSAIAIHNVRYPERIRAIYAEVADLLAAGGRFLNCDLVFGPPADLDTQLEWLQECGLEGVECFWQEGRQVIIGGAKPH